MSHQIVIVVYQVLVLLEHTSTKARLYALMTIFLMFQ